MDKPLLPSPSTQPTSSVLIPAPVGKAILRVETVYTSLSGPDLVQEWSELDASDTFGRTLRRFSTDGGHTWSSPITVFTPKETARGVERCGESALLFDAATGRLIRFYNWHIYPENRYTKDVARRILICWDCSSDGGVTFAQPQQLIVDGGTAEAWAPGIRFGDNSAMISFCAPFIDDKGRIILPATRFSEIRDDMPTYRLPMEAGCFIGEWEADRIIWRMSEMMTVEAKLSSRGMCEPATAQLRDGRFLMICRGSNAGMPEAPARKWMSTSPDAMHWEPFAPLGYDDGSLFYSPAAGSRLIRYSRTGKLYWIGNIVGANPDGNYPRHPLQIAEVDEERLAIRRDSVRVIDDRREGECETLQLSNFRAYEDRETGEIVVTLARLMGVSWEPRTAPGLQIRFIP